MHIPGTSIRIPDTATVREGVTATLELVPRLVRLVARWEGITDETEQILARLSGLADELEALTAQSGELLAVGRANADRVTGLVDGYEPLLRRAEPALRRLAEKIQPEDAKRAAEALARLPGLARQAEQLVPTLQQLDTVPRDVREMLHAIRALGHVMEGVPGIDRIRRRADDRDDHKE